MDSGYKTVTCPNCGEPIAVQAGVTEGICPNCKEFIPQDPADEYGYDPNQNYRIL